MTRTRSLRDENNNNYYYYFKVYLRSNSKDLQHGVSLYDVTSAHAKQAIAVRTIFESCPTGVITNVIWERATKCIFE